MCGSVGVYILPGVFSCDFTFSFNRDLYWEEAMTALEKMGEPPLMPNSFVQIMLKSAEGWDQVAAFVALTMRYKMEIARDRQWRPIDAATQHSMPDLATPPPPFLPSATQQQKQKMIQASLLRRHLAANSPPRPGILRS